MSTVSVAIQKINMTDVTKIIVSDIIQQQDGTYARAIRFYGNEVGVDGLQLLMETVSRSKNRADLVVATPAQGF
jgi:hypothetical protein